MSVTVPLDDAVTALKKMFHTFSGQKLSTAKAIELIKSRDLKLTTKAEEHVL